MATVQNAATASDARRPGGFNRVSGTRAFGAYAFFTLAFAFTAAFVLGIVG